MSFGGGLGWLFWEGISLAMDRLGSLIGDIDEYCRAIVVLGDS